MVYVTVPNDAEAEKIAKTLIESKLAACINVLAGAKSFYQWQGKIVRDHEHIMIIKTRQSKFNDLEQCVKQLHSYENPCVVQLPIESGSKAYLEWMQQQLN